MKKKEIIKQLRATANGLSGQVLDRDLQIKELKDQLARAGQWPVKKIVADQQLQGMNTNGVWVDEAKDTSDAFRYAVKNLVEKPETVDVFSYRQGATGPLTLTFSGVAADMKKIILEKDLDTVYRERLPEKSIAQDLYDKNTLIHSLKCELHDLKRDKDGEIKNIKNVVAYYKKTNEMQAKTISENNISIIQLENDNERLADELSKKNEWYKSWVSVDDHDRLMKEKDDLNKTLEMELKEYSNEITRLQEYNKKLIDMDAKQSAELKDLKGTPATHYVDRLNIYEWKSQAEYQKKEYIKLYGRFHELEEKVKSLESNKKVDTGTILFLKARLDKVSEDKNHETSYLNREVNNLSSSYATHERIIGDLRAENAKYVSRIHELTKDLELANKAVNAVQEQKESIITSLKRDLEMVIGERDAAEDDRQYRLARIEEYDKSLKDKLAQVNKLEKVSAEFEDVIKEKDKLIAHLQGQVDKLNDFLNNQIH